MYETRQPTTKSNQEAAMAEAAACAAMFPPARVNIRMKACCKELVVAKMAEHMRNHGEGMTRSDLMRLGYSEIIIEQCAAEANQLALRLALN